MNFEGFSKKSPNRIMKIKILVSLQHFLFSIFWVSSQFYQTFQWGFCFVNILRLKQCASIFSTTLRLMTLQEHLLHIQANFCSLLSWRTEKSSFHFSMFQGFKFRFHSVGGCKSDLLKQFFTNIKRLVYLLS